MQVTSTDFDNLETIPSKYSAHGENINPSLTFSEIPEGTESLALILEDPDAPDGLFTHWILYNMSPATLQIVQGVLPVSGVLGVNDLGEKDYFGPKPPAGTGSHRYMFKLFALDQLLEFDETTDVTRDKLYAAMEGHVVEEAEIVGMFSNDDVTQEETV